MRDYEDRFVKITDEPIAIETRIIDDYIDDSLNGGIDTGFWLGGAWHSLNDFARVHNNAWISGDFPDYIHGMETSWDWYGALYIELVGDEYVNVYEEIAEEV